MRYDTGKHCIFYPRYHLVWSTKYPYKVLTGDLCLRVRDICRQVCRENEVDITITIDIERHRTVCCIHRGKSGSGLNIHKCAVPESVKSIRLIKAASNENFVSIITINVDGGSSSERMDILVPDNIEINRYRLELWVL